MGARRGMVSLVNRPTSLVVLILFLVAANGSPAHAQPSSTVRSASTAPRHVLHPTDRPAPYRLFPSLRIGAGAAFSPAVGHPHGVTHDLTAGVRVFRAGGILYGLDVGYGIARRITHPGANFGVVGLPLGWVSRRNRVQLGARVDLLAGRWDRRVSFGARASAFVGIRHSAFLEGGIEQRWDDGASHLGYRVVLNADLGILLSHLGLLRVALH